MSDAAKTAIQESGAGFASVNDAGTALLRIVTDPSVIGTSPYSFPPHCSIADIRQVAV